MKIIRICSKIITFCCQILCVLIVFGLVLLCWSTWARVNPLLEDAGEAYETPTPHGWDGTPWSPTTVDATPTWTGLENYPCLTCEPPTPLPSSYPTENEGLPMCRRLCTALEATKLHWHGNPMICECYYEFQGAWAWRIVWIDRKENP